MADLTQEFDKQWGSLITQEIKLEEENSLFPVHSIDVNGKESILLFDELKKNLDRLHDETFTIAVCGAVKAGKSTFLNSLLFGRNVLPAFSTPMTAKINFIEYSATESNFLVNFYSAEEWKRLLDTLDDENLQQLEDRIQICSEDHGINKNDCVGSLPRIQNDLQLLEEYVSDPKAGKGKYTPFVKDVHIRINNPKIENLCIVDTPGLNDPNTINSDETLKWIKNAHAVIFLLRPKGYEASDKDFVDKNLLTTRPSNRLWIINKIDDLNNMSELNEVKNYLYNDLGKSKEFQAKNLFGKEEKICGYSSIISMLVQMMKNKETLSEEQKKVLFRVIGKDKNFNPDPDHVPEAISERLYANTGAKRIASGVALVEDVYSKTLQNAKKKSEECDRELKDLNTSAEDLKKQIQTINETRNELRSVLEKFLAEFKTDSLQIIRDTFTSRTIQKIESFETRIKAEIGAATTTIAMNQCSQSMQRQLQKIFGPTGDIMAFTFDCQKALRRPLEDKAKYIERIFEEKEIAAEVDFSSLNFSEEMTPFDTSKVVEELQWKLDASLPTNFFMDLLTSKASKRAVCASAIGDAVNATIEMLSDKTADFHKKVYAIVSSKFNTFNKDIESSCLKKEEKIGIDPKELENHKQKILKEKESAESVIKVVSKLKRAYADRLPVELRTKNMGD